MKRPAWMARCAPVVLAAFLAANGLPRASVYEHHHAGDEVPHVHPWGFDGVAEAYERNHPAPHHHVHQGVGFDVPTRDAPDHVHCQAPFQHGTTPPTPGLVPALGVVALAAAPRARPGVVHAVRRSARAPPAPLAA